VVPYGNVEGSVFFRDILKDGEVTDIGRRVLGSVLRFGFDDLPGDYERTVSSVLAAMPRLEHLYLKATGEQPADLEAALDALECHCPAAQSLSLDLLWFEICDITRSWAISLVSLLTDDPDPEPAPWQITEQNPWAHLNTRDYDGTSENEVDIPVVEQQSDAQDAGASGSSSVVDTSPWLPYLHINTTLTMDTMLWSRETFHLLSRRHLKDKWLGGSTKKVFVTMQYDWRFSPLDIAFELRDNLPWCEIEVKYRDGHGERRRIHHLAEVNRLLQMEHYISVGKIAALRAMEWDEVM
jgi:hypothetical protein